MYNVSEYILAKRSANITEKALEKSLTYRTFNEGENTKDLNLTTSTLYRRTSSF